MAEGVVRGKEGKMDTWMDALSKEMAPPVGKNSEKVGGHLSCAVRGARYLSFSGLLHILSLCVLPHLTDGKIKPRRPGA